MDRAGQNPGSTLMHAKENIMTYMQPIGWYVEEARAELPDNAPWPVVSRRAWQLQQVGEAAEERNSRAKFRSQQ
jgi:hypothetical protein